MPKLDGPMFSLGAHGSIGDAITYQKTKAGNIAHRKSKPINRNSEAQQEVREKYQSGVWCWGSASDYIKYIYNVTAEGTNMSGFNLFLSEYLKDRINANVQSQTIQPVNKDAEIDKENPDTNYGENSNIYFKRQINKQSRLIYEIDLTNIGLENIVDVIKAELKIYWFQISGGDPAGRGIEAYYLNKSQIYEDQVTWNDEKNGTAWDEAGGELSEELVTKSSAEMPDNINSWITIDITNAINYAIRNNDKICCVIIKYEQENASHEMSARVYTVQNGTPGVRPKVEIQYINYQNEI